MLLRWAALALYVLGSTQDANAQEPEPEDPPPPPMCADSGIDCSSHDGDFDEYGECPEAGCSPETCCTIIRICGNYAIDCSGYDHDINWYRPCDPQFGCTPDFCCTPLRCAESGIDCDSEAGGLDGEASCGQGCNVETCCTVDRDPPSPQPPSPPPSKWLVEVARQLAAFALG